MNDTQSELWKSIVGYEEFYEVSDQGRIRSLERNVPHKLYGQMQLKSQIMRLNKNGRGYVHVSLCRDGNSKSFAVHRLVLQSFVSLRPYGCEACHNDGNIDNNQLFNLRWDTTSANELDKFQHGTDKGMRIRRSDGVEFRSQHEAARFMGCSQGNIGSAVRGVVKTCGGYGWVKVVFDD